VADELEPDERSAEAERKAIRTVLQAVTHGDADAAGYVTAWAAVWQVQGIDGDTWLVVRLGGSTDEHRALPPGWLVEGMLRHAGRLVADELEPG
jgi:hypothetical protein